MERRKGREKLDRIKMQRRRRRNSALKRSAEKSLEEGVYNIDRILFPTLISHAVHSSIRQVSAKMQTCFLFAFAG